MSKTTSSHTTEWAQDAQRPTTALLPPGGGEADRQARAWVARRVQRRAFDTVVEVGCGSGPIACAATTHAVLDPDDDLVSLYREMCRRGLSLLREARSYDGMVASQTTRRTRLGMVRELVRLFALDPGDAALQLYLRCALREWRKGPRGLVATPVAEPLDVALPSPQALTQALHTVSGVDFVSGGPDAVGLEGEVFAGPCSLVFARAARFTGGDALQSFTLRCGEWVRTGAEVVVALPDSDVRSVFARERGWRIHDAVAVGGVR